MKKILALTISMALLIGGLAACEKKTESAPDNAADNNRQLTIVTTLFPPYDFVKAIGGEHANVSMLVPPGAESHSYEPSPQDIIKIQNADLFIYNGGESESWVKEMLQSMGDKAPATLKMMDSIQLLQEEETPRMEVTDDHDMDDVDEHVWTSPKNAIAIAKAIAEKMVLIDDKNATEYKENLESYVQLLQGLDDSFSEVVKNGKRKTIVFGDRFPFRYLANELNLDYYAAFLGCSTQSDASASTIAFLVNKVKEEKMPVILYIEFSNHKVADAIAEATGTKTMMVHSCHNVSPRELENGVTYLSLMKENVKVLEEVLK